MHEYSGNSAEDRARINARNNARNNAMKNAKTAAAMKQKAIDYEV